MSARTKFSAIGGNCALQATLFTVALAIAVVGTSCSGAASESTAVTEDGTSKETAATNDSPVLDLDEIRTLEDLEPFTGIRRSSFCNEVLNADPDEPKMIALHERLGIDGSGYENLIFGCMGVPEADAEAAADKSGAFDERYRRRASEWRDQARRANVDLYDMNLEPDGQIMARRVFSTLYGRPEPTLHIEYSTAWNGSYSRRGSEVAAVVDVFSITAFPDERSGCGPDAMEIEPLHGSRISLEGGDQACTELDQQVLGAHVFRHDRWQGVSTYTITVGSTRIAVQARSQAEAFALLASLEPASADDIDFFNRND